ncbi:hypothetical protein FO519_006841 [Halicephalobus sp. NKZ332]|nr:hypothetical protein FO519_006841 [Halicephalobus sp. NKZ332]
MAEGTPFGEGLIIKKATQADFQDILDFLNEDFLLNEPLMSSLDGKRHELEPLFIDWIKQGLAEPNLTYFVSSTETNKIVGLRLTSVIKRPLKHYFPQYEHYSADAIAKIVAVLENKTWEILPLSVNQLASLMILSVKKEFTRRGIAQKLVEYKLDEIKKAGCSGIITEASAYKSQDLFAKVGFTVLHEILHSDWKDESSQVIFKSKDRTDRIQLNYIGL